MSKLKANEYQCEICLGVFVKGWSDEEAQAEYEQLFPKHVAAKADKGVVCDDCYKKLVAWKPPEQAEAEL